MDVTADMSLDDIIQKKYNKLGNRRGKRGIRGQQRSQLSSSGSNKNAPSRRSGSQQGVRRGMPGRTGRAGGQGGRNSFPPIGDARSRITQKKRMKITDAREKLGEIAKQNDARQKLDRLRLIRSRAQTAVPLPLRGGIVAETGRNGQLRLSTSKNRGIHKSTKPLGRVISTDRRGLLSATIPSLLGLTININDEDRTLIRRTVNNSQPATPPSLFSPARSRDSYSSWMNSGAQDSDMADDSYGLASRRMMHPREPERFMSPPRRQIPQNFRVTRRTSPVPASEGYYGSQADMDVGYPDEDSSVTQHHSSPINRATSGIKARLDTPPVPRRTMGILSTESKITTTEVTRSAAPTTHRIVVSNLQKSVTNEDIRELFEDIGSLIVSRLVRPGTAEVIYRTRKDAEKAVETYHNRQLDGEPMKCMLVNPRSVPTIGQSSGPKTTNVPLSGSPNKFRSGNKGQKLSVTPDVATIHKALFKRS